MVYLDEDDNILNNQSIVVDDLPTGAVSQLYPSCYSLTFTCRRTGW